jgi:hypothetical protein
MRACQPKSALTINLQTECPVWLISAVPAARRLGFANLTDTLPEMLDVRGVNPTNVHVVAFEGSVRGDGTLRTWSTRKVSVLAFQYIPPGQTISAALAARGGLAVIRCRARRLRVRRARRWRWRRRGRASRRAGRASRPMRFSGRWEGPSA